MHTEHPVRDYRTVVTDDAQFIDVREPHEVADGTLPGTVNIPLGELEHRRAELDPTRRVVLLCRSGNRSSKAAEYLTSIGFTDVVNLVGGMLAADATS